MVCQLTASDGDSSDSLWGTLTYGSLSVTSCQTAASADCATAAASVFPSDALSSAGVLSIKGVVNSLELATITVTAVATDGGGATNTGTFTVTVTEVNNLPVCGTINTLYIAENSVGGVEVIFQWHWPKVGVRTVDSRIGPPHEFSGIARRGPCCHVPSPHSR